MRPGASFVVLLGALTMMPPLSIDVSLPGLPLIAGALRASGSAMQASLSLFILTFGVGQLIVGLLSDRYGRRPVLLFGLALFTLAGVACTFATTVPVLLFVRFVQGLGACAGTVVGRAVIQDVSRERTHATALQAYVTTLSSLAPMFAPLLGVAILAVTGWRCGNVRHRRVCVRYCGTERVRSCARRRGIRRRSHCGRTRCRTNAWRRGRQCSGRRHVASTSSSRRDDGRFSCRRRRGGLCLVSGARKPGRNERSSGGCLRRSNRSLEMMLFQTARIVRGGSLGDGAALKFAHRLPILHLMYAYEAGVFVRNCRALADAARACGARLVMLPEHAVSIEVRGESVAFPIATDDREWAVTTPEEAFYAAMLDAQAATDRESQRVAVLAVLLGGDAVLENVLRAGGLRDNENRFSR